MKTREVRHAMFREASVFQNVLNNKNGSVLRSSFNQRGIDVLPILRIAVIRFHAIKVPISPINVYKL